MATNGGRRTGSAGRFGARYGRVARRRVAQIEAETNADHGCPECGRDDVEREGTGIWECAACGYRFAGGTYRPQTPGGRSARRSIRTALAEEGGEVTEVATDVGDEAAEDAAEADAPEPGA